MAAGVEANAPVGEVDRSSQREGADPLRPDLPVGDWAALPAYRFRLLGRPMSYVLSAWAEPWRGNRSPRDPGFMNPTGAPEPLGNSGRIVWGISFLTAGARECTHGCSPWAIRVESSRGFFVLPMGEVLFHQRVRMSAPVGVAPELPGDSDRIAWGFCQRACVRHFLGIRRDGACGSWRRCSPCSRGS